MKNLYATRHISTSFVFALFFLAMQTSDAQVVVNEYSASNLSTYADNYGEYEDWFELYNTDLVNPANIGGFYLSDDLLNLTKYLIPAGVTIPAGSRMVFWADSRNEFTGGYHHTSFNLSQMKNNKEGIFFSDATALIVDKVDSLDVTALGHSRGRATDGASTWRYFSTPTFNASNNTGSSFGAYTETPSIDSSAGFYSGPFMVSIYTQDTNLTIHYTRDGRAPTIIDSVYTVPLSITKTTILKAMAVHSSFDTLQSFVNFKTFFLNEFHVLPVVSISGTNLLGLANGNGNLKPHGSFEYFDETKARKAKGYGEYNRHGNDSWAYNQRGLDYVTRDEMGYAKDLKEQFFVLSPRTEFQRLILRPEGNDNYRGTSKGAHVRDMYNQHLAERAHMSLSVRRSEKCIVYLNGAYWGVYCLREKVDDHDYTQFYHGQGKYDLQVIKTWGGTWSEYGGPQSITDWDNLHNYILSNSMAIQSNYDYADSLLDMMSVIDYMLLNSFVVNSDWLNWNTGWWRGLDPTGTHTKWGYLLWDQDNTFGNGVNYTGIPSKSATADPCYQDSITSPSSDPEGHSAMLQALRANPDFEQMYVSRYADLLNTYFSCDSLIAILDSIVALVDTEMTRHCLRWNGTYAVYKANVDTLRSYINKRCVHVVSSLDTCYNITGPYEVAYKINPDTVIVGGVKVNSLVVPYFPWGTNYYGGIPTLLKAWVTDTNWKFDKWTAANHVFTPSDTLDTVSVNLTMQDVITAHFVKKIIFVPVGSELPFVNDPGTQISVFPNPFHDVTTIRIKGNVMAGKVEVYDLLGKPVRMLLPASANEFSLSSDGLSNGVYWYRVIDSDGLVIGNGKVVIE